MPRKVLDLRKSAYFPTYGKLPRDGSLNENYYTLNGQSGIYQPRKHWCYIAEIIRDDTVVRPTFLVKDKKGHENRVAFHLDGLTVPIIRMETLQHKPFSPPSFNNVPCKVGNTICIMYAHQHDFEDFTHGIRVEECELVSVLPCTLEKLLSLNDSLQLNPTSCKVCQKNTTLRCSKCHILYCSRGCQMADWKQGHKTECCTLKRLQEWSAFDWAAF